MATSRFRRSKTDHMVTGVCAGLAAYLGIDVTLVRFGFVILTMASGVGIPLYILFTVVTPSAGEHDDVDIRFADGTEMIDPTRERQQLVAYGLIAGGTMLILSQIGWISSGWIWPILLIGLGIYIWRQR